MPFRSSETPPFSPKLGIRSTHKRPPCIQATQNGWIIYIRKTVLPAGTMTASVDLWEMPGWDKPSGHSASFIIGSLESPAHGTGTGEELMHRPLSFAAQGKNNPPEKTALGKEPNLCRFVFHKIRWAVIKWLNLTVLLLIGSCFKAAFITQVLADNLRLSKG